MNRPTAILLLTVLVLPAPASEIPLGHPDFYPSSERPIGWRGDGTCVYPGADCVTTWNAETGENVVWQTDLPGAGFSQPIVVGEKVLYACDPNLLVCLSAHDGKILWQTAIDHTTVMDPATAKKAREEIAFFREKRFEYCRWCDGCEELARMLVAKGVNVYGDMKNTFWRCKASHHLLKDPAVVNGTLASSLQDPQIKTAWERLYAEQKASGWFLGQGGNTKLFGGRGDALEQRWQRANRLYDIWFLGKWEGFGTWSFATPVCDGERVYMTTVNNAVAAMTLDGEIDWLVWEHCGNAQGERNSSAGVGTRYIASPVLCGDTLVVNQDHHMRAYDKRTGKKLWGHVGAPAARNAKLRAMGIFKDGFSAMTREIPDDQRDRVRQEDWDGILRAHKPRHRYRVTPEGVTPVVLKVPVADGSVMPVICDCSGLLYRLEDGKVLRADLPFHCNSTPIAVDNLLLQGGHDFGTKLMRLTAPDRDTVEVEFVYRAAKKEPKDKDAAANWTAGGGNSALYHDGWWYVNHGHHSKHKPSRIRVADGTLERLPYSGIGAKYSCTIRAGEVLYAIGGGRYFRPAQDWDRRAAIKNPRAGVGGATIYDLRSGKKTGVEVSHIDHRVFEDSAFGLRNRRVGSGSNMLSNSSPTAQANRIFYRTKGIAWCYGDPKRPFPVPKGCPPQGRIGTGK